MRLTPFTLLAALTLITACGPSRRERTISALTPTRLDTGDASADRARPPLRFRIYADRQWQAQKQDWRRTAEDMIEQASAVARYDFGVGFIVERIATWPEPGPNERLEARLDRLVHLDPGGAEVWVVGLVGGQPVASSTYEHIGMARMPGRHFVMRSMADLDEARALEGLVTLDDSERRRLLRQRMKHRRAVVFLHEWAHSLGAVHARSHDTIMASSYWSRVKGFAPATLGLGLAVLNAESPPGADDTTRLAAQSEAARAWYLAHPQAAVDPIEREALIAGPTTTPTTAPRPATADGELRTRPEIEAAMEAGRVSAVLAAVVSTPEDARAEVAAWARTTRRRFAMPEGFPTDDEADYVAAQRAIDAVLTEGDLEAAATAITALEARWPDAAAGPQLRCDLAGRRADFDEARRRCRDATKRDGESIGAWLMLGMIELHTRHPEAAVAPLRRVIELDDGQIPAWITLGRTYDALNRSADKRALADRFRRVHGKPLPE